MIDHTYVQIRYSDTESRNEIYTWLRGYAPGALLAHKKDGWGNSILVEIRFNTSGDAVAFRLKFGWLDDQNNKR